MSVLTIDFETFYSSDYSLSKMTTEEYIRSPLFEVIGVAVAVDDAEPVWFSGSKEEVKEFLDGFPWAESLALAHNAMFDMAILNWHFDIRPKRILDTLSMARPLHGTSVGGSLKALTEFYNLGEKGTEVVNALGKRRANFTPEALARYGEYCANDVRLTYSLFLTLMEEGFPKEELQLIDVTVRMFTEPVLVLEEHVLQTYKKLVVQRQALLLNAAEAERGDLNSNPKFARMLEALHVVPPTKISATTGEETWAFSKQDEEFMALQEHPDLQVQALMAARLGVRSTLEATRTQRLIGVAQRGPEFPIPLRYYAAHTGRWGGDDKINVQNLGRGSQLKEAILAPYGFTLVNCDSSQIEARTLAWLAEQDDLVAAFANGEDVYKQMASAVFNKDEVDITKVERFVGKTTVLGAGYGVGALKLLRTLRSGPEQLIVSAPEAEHIISTYRRRYFAIPQLWDQANNAIRAMMSDTTTPLGRGGVLVVEGRRGIRLPNGFYLHYPYLRTERDEDTGRPEVVYDTKKGRTAVRTRLYGGKLVENIVQALARIIVARQLLMVNKKYRVAMTVHDSVLAVVPEDEVDRAVEYITMVMRFRPEWAPDLPLNCEAGHGRSYGSC
jgi:DNA polymerase